MLLPPFLTNKTLPLSPPPFAPPPSPLPPLPNLPVAGRGRGRWSDLGSGRRRGGERAVRAVALVVKVPHLRERVRGGGRHDDGDDDDDGGGDEDDVRRTR